MVSLRGRLDAFRLFCSLKLKAAAAEAQGPLMPGRRHDGMPDATVAYEYIYPEGACQLTEARGGALTRLKLLDVSLRMIIHIIPKTTRDIETAYLGFFPINS